ncbi:Rrf2 family transcriptional regulator [soil metagenome]
MISQTTEYALRVIVHLASLDGKPATIQQIAKATLIPPGYLAKVLKGLSRAGLVISQRGLHGGSILARSPSKITVYEVVQSVAPLARILTCPLGLRTHGTKLCALHRRLDDAIAMVEAAFRKSTIADLLAEPNRSSPLCDTQRVAKNGPVSRRAAFSKPVPLSISRKA